MPVSTTVLTIKEQAQKALAIVTKISEFGPKAPEFTGHLQAGVAEFIAAKDMLVQHFGLAADDAPSFDALVAECSELGAKCDQLTGLCGVGDNKGPFRDFLMLVITNPAFMTFLLSLLKIPA